MGACSPSIHSQYSSIAAGENQCGVLVNRTSSTTHFYHQHDERKDTDQCKCKCSECPRPQILGKRSKPRGFKRPTLTTTLQSNLEKMPRHIWDTLVSNQSIHPHLICLVISTARSNLSGATNHSHMDSSHIHLHPGRDGYQDRRIQKGIPAITIQSICTNIQLWCS